eukprot:TRINITY_DN30925_c0_g1_i1.p2 TRINITY_DN30925_c0_g1~~TRINITY_DN30925_c0_g1_i1.p2  ORF type:complete len:140 (-),score=43.59 TRINITY_DN30925_c0_g1_i1:460-879(-)
MELWGHSTASAEGGVKLSEFKGRNTGCWEEYDLDCSQPYRFIRLVIKSNYGAFYTGINRIEVVSLEGSDQLDVATNLAKVRADRQQRKQAEAQAQQEAAAEKEAALEARRVEQAELFERKQREAAGRLTRTTSTMSGEL